MTIAVVVAIVGVAWFSMRYAWWRPAADEAWPRILMYHMISPPRAGARFNGLRVSPAMFERQLRWLQQNGWRSFTVSELFEAADRLPEKAFALTFDDGYADNLFEALPLLKKFNCKATLYLVVERFDRDWSVERKRHHDSGELRREPKLSDDQVRMLLDSGCFELGSHSMTHPNFLRLDADATEHELFESRRELAQRFNVDIKSFAWPFGLYRSEQVKIAERAGYVSAVTTLEGVEAPDNWQAFQLKRIKISGKDNWLAFLLRMRSGHRGWR